MNIGISKSSDGYMTQKFIDLGSDGHINIQVDYGYFGRKLVATVTSHFENGKLITISAKEFDEEGCYAINQDNNADGIMDKNWTRGKGWKKL